MLKECLEFLKNTFVGGECGQFVKGPDCVPKDIYFIRGKDGTIEQHIAEMPKQNDIVYVLDDFCKQAPAETKVCYIGLAQIVAVDDLHGRCRMPLNFSPQFASLGSPMVNLSHKELIRLLSVDLYGCVNDDDLRALRSLKIKSVSDGESRIDNGNESVAKSIKREAIGDGATFPREIYVIVHPYENVREFTPIAVRCVIHLDLETSLFDVLVLSGEIERAKAEVARSIVAKIESARHGINVVLGEPTPSRF